MKKRYYNFIWILQPANKVVKDLVLYLTESEYHKKCAEIAFKMEESGLSFNGKNHLKYFDFLTRDINDEYLEVKRVTDNYLNNH